MSEKPRHRISSTGSCQRQRVMALRDYPQDMVDGQTRGIFRRGIQVEAEAVADLRELYDGQAGSFHEQFEVETRFGTGHPDVVWFDNDGSCTVWEIKSSAGGLNSGWVWQLRSYLWAIVEAGHAEADAVHGIVRIVDPSTLQHQDYPIGYDDSHAAFIVEDNDTVARLGADESAPLPDRVCEHPEDGPARFCRFVSVCFKDWQPPTPDSLPDAMTAAAQELAELQTQKAQLAKDGRQLDSRIRELQSALRTTLLPGNIYVGDGVRVKLGKESVRASFSMAKARDAGVWTAEDEERFAPYISASSSVRVSAELPDEGEPE